MEQFKYPKLVRKGNRVHHVPIEKQFNPNDTIVVTEKLDGANASFFLDSNEIHAFSRNQKLSDGNTLRGFYPWVISHVMNKVDFNDYHLIVDKLILFGEWLVPHTVAYGDHFNTEDRFYLFDAYNVQEKRFLNWFEIELLAKILKLKTPAVLYRGKASDTPATYVELLKGKTMAADGIGEGVVVKHAYYGEFDGQNYMKVITPEYSETRPVRKTREPKPATALQHFVMDHMTRVRVEKTILKLIDEGDISPDATVQDMGTVLPKVNAAIVKDLFEEEAAAMPEGTTEKELTATVGRKAGSLIRQFLEVRQNG